MATHYASGTPTQAPTTNSGVLLDLPANGVHSPLVLVHDETAWRDTPRGWRPAIRSVQCIPGVQGCMEVNGRLVIEPLVNTLGAQGKTVIRPNDRRLDSPHQEWHREAPAKRGGIHHHCSWESFGKIGTRSKTVIDEVVLDAFTDHLTDKGLVQPMSADALSIKLEIVDNRILDTTGEKRERFQKQRDKMVADWEKQFGAKSKGTK